MAKTAVLQDGNDHPTDDTNDHVIDLYRRNPHNLHLPTQHPEGGALCQCTITQRPEGSHGGD